MPDVTVWPFMPDVGMSERLEWRTDVIRAKSAEQRIATRTAPRQGFTHAYLLNEREFSIAKMRAKSLSASSFKLPNWGDLTEVGAVSSGTDNIAFDTSYADYRVGGEAIIWESVDNFELVTIDGILPGALNIDGTVANDYTDAIVAPVVSAIMTQPLSADRADAPYTRVTAQFISTDTIDLADTMATTDYLGAPVLLDTRYKTGGLEERFVRETDRIDNDTGLISLATQYAAPISMSAMSWVLDSREAIWDLRLWLHYCRGRQRAFWLPSYNNDLEITDDISSADTTISIAAINYSDYETQRDVMITDTSGNNYFLRLTTGVSAGANETITLSGSAGFNLAAADIARVSFLTYMRNNADRIELYYYHTAHVTVTVPVMEVPAP